MAKKKASVSIVDIAGDVPGAVAEAMDLHRVDELIREKPEEVYLKVNGIDFKPYAYTSTEVTGAVIDYCRSAGASKVFLMENSTQSNITRLVFHITGFDRVAQLHGAQPLYLDEGKQSKVRLPHLDYEVSVSRHVRRIIENREEVCYINLPKLKTHSMTVLTAGIKNQYGLISHKDRSQDHNFRLHRKLADIYSILQPDYTLVDGSVGTIYGHYPPEALHGKALVPFDILIGGTDTLAVDVVCARVFGYRPGEVKHLEEASEMGLGCGDLGSIEVVGGPLERFEKKYPYELYDAFPHDVEIIRGKERNCTEGCYANTMALLQVLYLDFEGKGGFTIVMGKGFDPDEIDRVRGRVFIAGACAYDETGRLLKDRLGKKNVFFTRECNDLAGATAGLGRLMKVSPLRMVPIDPLKSLELLLKAKLNRTTARIPPLIPL